MSNFNVGDVLRLDPSAKWNIDDLREKRTYTLHGYDVIFTVIAAMYQDENRVQITPCLSNIPHTCSIGCTWYSSRFKLAELEELIPDPSLL